MYSSISPGVNTGFSKIGSDPCLQGLPSSGGEEFCVLTSSLLLCSPLLAQQYFGTLCTVALVTGVGCSVYSSSQMLPSVAAICSRTVPPQVCILPEGHSGLCSLFTNPGVRECLPLSTCLLSAGIIPSSFISPSLPYIRCFLTTLSKLTSDRLDAGLETPNMVFQDSKT